MKRSLNLMSEHARRRTQWRHCLHLWAKIVAGVVLMLGVWGLVEWRACQQDLQRQAIAEAEYEPIRQNFVTVLEQMFKRGVSAGIATHDKWLTQEAQRLIDAYGIPRDRYEFQMLLGVTEELRRRLIAAGHRMRVYIPYGKNWYAYSVRRLRENPQLAGHGFRAIFKRS